MRVKWLKTESGVPCEVPGTERCESDVVDEEYCSDLIY